MGERGLYTDSLIPGQEKQMNSLSMRLLQWLLPPQLSVTLFSTQLLPTWCSQLSNPERPLHADNAVLPNQLHLRIYLL